MIDPSSAIWGYGFGRISKELEERSDEEPWERDMISPEFDVDIIGISKDSIQVRVKNRGDFHFGYGPKKSLCVEIRKMLEEPITVMKKILFIKRKVEVYDVTIGRHCIGGGVKPFAEKTITIQLDEPIDPEKRYSIALLECKKGKNKGKVLLICWFSPKELLSREKSS